MRCEICKTKEATIHLTEISDGVRSETHLCEQCAHNEGLAVKSHIPINELLANLLATQPTDEDILGDVEEMRCPSCGFTLQDFTKKAVLGCPADYEVFEKSLLPLIEKAHNGRSSHSGKIPSKIPSDTKEQIELMSLRQQLDEAVRAENYELAAQLRDKINQYEEG